MPKVAWDKTGERFYETGTDRGVVYLSDAKGKYGEGVAWNGLRTVTEAPEGAEETALYADNIKYLSMMSVEEFKGSIGAYQYPDAIAVANGEMKLAEGITVDGQSRRMFAMTFRTLIGNDVQGSDYGYKIHIVYGVKIQPSEKAHETVNDDPTAVELEWDFVTTPETIPNAKASSHIVIDSTKVSEASLKAIEDALYGTETAEPKVLLPAELMALVNNGAPVSPEDQK